MYSPSDYPVPVTVTSLLAPQFSECFLVRLWPHTLTVRFKYEVQALAQLMQVVSSNMQNYPDGGLTGWICVDLGEGQCRHLPQCGKP
jgi:hypothetical protein